MTPDKIENFLRYAIGHREVGVADGESVDVPVAPELRAFLDGCMTDGCPTYPYRVLPTSKHHYEPHRAKQLAEILRAVADHIDPPQT